MKKKGKSADQCRKAVGAASVAPEATARVVLMFANDSVARVVASAIAVDNEGWVIQKISGRRLEARIRASGPASLRRTVDDWLAAASLAAKAQGHVAPASAENVDG